eukprot:scaffold126374_cov63-Attheya_sp.AAC.4
MPQYCDWDPRPLTQLCATVQAARTGTGTQLHESASASVSASASASSDVVMCGSSPPRSHVLQEFAEQASLVELRVLLKHVLTKLGYDPTATSLIMNGDGTREQDHYGNTFALHELPQTFDPSIRANNNVMHTHDEKNPLLFPLHEHEALVVTTAVSPHTIVHVNQAWLDLCGFSTRQEAEGQTFSIIQGPESNTFEAANMVRRCHETLQPQEAYMVNYTASGERFINHVTIGPLYPQSHPQYAAHNKDKPNHNMQPDWFVGILEKVT